MEASATSPTVATNRRPHQQAAREMLRESLLDASAELMTNAPWSEISMAAIASRAGVSRQTLYNEFGSRDEFAQHYALREADRFLTTVEDAIGDDPADPLQALREGFIVFLDAAENNPMVRHIVVRDPGADELLSLFTTRGGPVLELATYRLTQKIRSIWTEADEADARTLAEGLVRMAISHASLPATSPAQSADNVVALLAPFIAQALGVSSNH
ncbi:MAG: TetR family transcriptional regulator [Solirubrobacterales bacterium]